VTYNAKGTCWYLLYRHDEDYTAFTTTGRLVQRTDIVIEAVPAPEKTAHLRAALLYHRPKAQGLSFGLTAASANRLAAWLNTLLPDLDRLAGQLGWGTAMSLSIEADDGCWLVDSPDLNDQILVCLPEPQIPVALARACLTRLKGYFSRLESGSAANA
jgi:hypothetical protein